MSFWTASCAGFAPSSSAAGDIAFHFLLDLSAVGKDLSFGVKATNLTRYQLFLEKTIG
jgi:hypothetical protein